MSSLESLQQVLGVSFNDPSMLKHALMHSSYINENPSLTPGSNERLEFLGDSVLGLIITEKLYHDLPQSAEGELTKLRSALVSRDALARVAQTINLGDYLYLGKGEESSGGRQKPANLADTLEAVIAAVFLDRALAITRRFILRIFKKELEDITRRKFKINYKSRLQEIILSQGQHLPTYHVLNESGPDHNRWFTVEVRLEDTVLGHGAGKSKKQAETEAARIALANIQQTTQEWFQNPF